MRLRWFKNLNPTIQLLVLLGVIFVLLAFYVPLSKYIQPATTSLLSYPLRLSEGLSSNARGFLKFQDLAEENKRLKSSMDKLTAQLAQLQDASLENERLRGLLSLPKRTPLQVCTAFVVGRDSSNLTETILINKGTLDGVKKGSPVVLGENLLGTVIEAHASVSKAALIVDFNSKIPAKILRTREEGVVFGALKARQNVCKIKYVQKVKIGDRVVTSGLGRAYPKGLLIGEVIAVEEGKNQLYKVARILPVVELSGLEEVAVITSKVESSK